MVNDYLYSLIAELNRQERLHITNSLKQNKGNTILVNYFNYLCGLKEFDEQQIKKSVKNDTIKKFYPQYKRKLYNAILKAMRSYANHNAIEKVIYDLLDDITFLFGKGRVSAASALIDKGLEITQKHQIFEFEAIFWKWRLQTVSRTNKFLNETEFKRINKEVERCNHANNKLMVNRLKHYNYIFEKRNNILNLPPKKRAIAARNLLESLNLQEDDTNIPEINYGYHLLHYQIYTLENNVPKIKHHLDKAVELIGRKPYKETKDYYNYVVGLANLCEIAYLERNTSLLELYLNDLKSIHKRQGNNSFVMPILENYIPIFELQLCLLTNCSSGDRVVKKVIKRIDISLNGPSIKSSLCISAATYYWVKRNNNKALDFINRFKEFQNASNHNYSYKFLELVIYYEMKEYSLLESKSRSLYRYLSEQGHYNDVERTLMKLLKKGIHRKNKAETNQILEKLLDNFKNADNNESIISLQFIYFQEWLESQLSGKLMEYVIEDNAKLVAT